MKELKKYPVDYLILATSGVFFLLLLKIFQGEKVLNFIILFIYTSFYILWGIYHHAVNKTLHLKNVIEYILIGFTVILLIQAIILFF